MQLMRVSMPNKSSEGCPSHYSAASEHYNTSREQRAASPLDDISRYNLEREAVLLLSFKKVTVKCSFQADTVLAIQLHNFGSICLIGYNSDSLLKSDKSRSEVHDADTYTFQTCSKSCG